MSKSLKDAESSLSPMKLPHGQEAPAKLGRGQAWLVSLSEVLMDRKGAPVALVPCLVEEQVVGTI